MPSDDSTVVLTDKWRLRSPPKHLLRSFETYATAARVSYNWMLAYTAEMYREFLIKWKETEGEEPSKRPRYSHRKTTIEALKAFRQGLRDATLCNGKGELYSPDFISVLAKVSSSVYDNVRENLQQAWETKRKHKFPAFKKYSLTKKSFQLHRKNSGDFPCEISTGENGQVRFHICLPILGWVEIDRKSVYHGAREDADIKKITILSTPYGWQLKVAIGFTPGEEYTREKNGSCIGIDWGVKHFATDSDGYYHHYTEETLARYHRAERKIKKLDQQICLKRRRNPQWKRSKAYARLVQSRAKLYHYLSNLRQNFLHSVSRYYAIGYDFISIELLKAKNLLKNHKLAKSISEASYYMWRCFLEYKCRLFGTSLTLKNPAYTSQTCSSCGCVKKGQDKLGLGEREFYCEACGISLDRDINAAINILSAPAL